MKNSERLLLFDAHALIYRAFYAFPDLRFNGQLLNAVYGFNRILLTVLRNYEPDYVAIAFDHRDKTFRHKTFDGYKAQRKKMPEELQPQIEIVKETVDALNIPRFEIAGYEADDLIGTIAKKEQSVDILIVTGDKDLLQLVSERIHVLIPARSKKKGDMEYDPALVSESMGVTPGQVTDLKALMGDSSDNIPGVKGIGKKTATSLIQAFSSIEELYKQLHSVEKDELPMRLTPSVFKKLTEGKNDALLSKELVTIQQGAPINFKLEDCRLNGYKKQEAIDLYNRLGFRSLIQLLPADDFELGVQEALL